MNVLKKIHCDTSNINMAFLLDYFEDPPAPRINRIRINPIDEYRDIEFKKRYRLPKQSIELLGIS